MTGDYDGPNLWGVRGMGSRSGPGPTLTQDRLRFYKKSNFNDMTLLFRARNTQLIHNPTHPGAALKTTAKPREIAF
jgi:hypothetical protein